MNPKIEASINEYIQNSPIISQLFDQLNVIKQDIYRQTNIYAVYFKNTSKNGTENLKKKRKKKLKELEC